MNFVKVLFLSAFPTLFAVVCQSQTPELVIPVGHSLGITSTVFSPDDKRIISTGRDQNIKIWDANTGLLIKTIQHSGIVRDALFSHDSKYIIVSTFDSVFLWVTATGKLVRKFDSGPIVSAKSSHDNRFIITSSFNRKSVWDFNTGALIKELVSSKKENHHDFERDWFQYTTGRLSPSVEVNSNSTLVIGQISDSTIGIWETESWRLIHTLQHGSRVQSCKFTKDELKVITTDQNNKVFIWNVKTGTLIKSIEVGDSMDTSLYNTVFNSAQSMTFTLENNKINVLETDSGRVQAFIYDSTSIFQSANFSNSGLQIATGSNNNSIKIWDSKNGNLIREISGTKLIRSAKLNQDKSSLGVALGNSIVIIDITTGLLSHKFSPHKSDIYSFDFSPNKKNMISRSAGLKEFQLWDLNSGEIVSNLSGYSGKFNASGNSIYYFDQDKIIKLDVDKRLVSSDFKHILIKLNLDFWSKPVSSLFSIDSNDDLFIPTEVNRISLYDSLGNTRRLFEYPEKYYNMKNDARSYPSAVISPDGKYIALHILGDDSLRIWNLTSAKRHRTISSTDADLRSQWWAGYFIGYGDEYAFAPNSSVFLSGNYTSINSPFFSDDSQKLFFNTLEKITRIYDLSTDKVETINGAVQGVIWKTGLAFVIENHQLKVIDLKTKETKLTWIPLGDFDYVITHPSGLFDASQGAMDKLHFNQGLDIIQFDQLKERYYEPGLWKKIMAGESLRKVDGFKSIELPPDIRVTQVDEKGYLNIGLTNRGGGIGEVNVFINGKEVIKDARKLNAKSDASTLTIKVFVGNNKSIVKGQDNLIGVKAWNKGHWVVSRSQVVSYKSTEIEEYQPSIYILTCGVSDYTGSGIDLKYAAKDADDISIAFQVGAKKLFGAEKSYVYNLTTSGAKESYPTKVNILKAFEKISRTAHPLDIFVVYVSGHGINYGGQDGDWYYLTQDAYTANASAYIDPAIRQQTTISSNELIELFKKVPALKQVLLIDACASGKVVDNLMIQKDIESSTLRALDRMRDRTGMHIITGCTADAVSYEASKFGQGVLTYSLLEGIRGAALREDQYVDVNKLFQYAQERVPQLAQGIGGIQTPQVFSPQGGQSYDIGLLTDQEKKVIPIASIRPVYIRSNFIDDDQLEDALQLGKLIDESLNEAASRGVNSNIIFVDVRDYPEGCKLSGRYTQENGLIKLKLRRKCESRDVTMEIEGKSLDEVKKKILDIL